MIFKLYAGKPYVPGRKGNFKTFRVAHSPHKILAQNYLTGF